VGISRPSLPIAISGRSFASGRGRDDKHAGGASARKVVSLWGAGTTLYGTGRVRDYYIGLNDFYGGRKEPVMQARA